MTASNPLIQPWPSVAGIGREVRSLLSSGDGIYVWDEAGNRLIDGPAGMWCTNVGHRNQVLSDAMRDQAMDLSFNSPWYTSNTPATTLAHRIAEHAPGDLNHTFFTTGGSTAVESALRFAQFYNNVRGRKAKKKILCREEGYHGSTYLASSLNGSSRSRDWMDYVENQIIKLSSPNPLRRADDMSIDAFVDSLVAEFDQTVAQHGADSICAFIAEPIMASGGVIVPPPGYLKRIRERCTANEILFIADEVVTGFGRLGHVFASEAVFDVVPDMITFAKGVTSGYFPLGGVVISAGLLDDLHSSEQDDATFAHGLTYSSHPVGCAVALKNLDLLEGGILEHARAMAPIFQDKLKQIESLPLVGEVRGEGLMACVECVADRVTKNPIRLDTEVGTRIDAHCQRLGLLLRPLINMCVMSPPLVINEEQIDTMASILTTGIEHTMEDLRREGIWNA